MRILLIGATGFVGRSLLPKLVEANHQVYAVSRNAESSSSNVISLSGDITNSAQMAEIFEAVKPQVVINLVAIIRGQPDAFDQIIRKGNALALLLTKRFHVKRYIYVSAIGADLLGETSYFRAKGRAEQDTKESNLDWTVFRPSVIFGPGAGFTGEIIRGSKFLPFWPAIRGEYLLQPVSIEVLTDCITQACSNPRSIKQVYDVAGPEVLTFTNIIRRLKEATNSRKPLLFMPLLFMKLVAILGDIGLPVPITTDQLAMLQKGSCGETEKLKRDFRVKEIKFITPNKLF